MSAIVLRGQWLYIWAIWHLAWLAGLFWVPFFAPDWTVWYYRVLYTVFLPLEIWGTLWKQPAGVDVASTLSEWRQYVAQLGKGSPALGWKALAAGTALVDAVLVWHVTRDVSPVVGAVLATVVWLWLAPHFSYRERVG